MPSTSSSAAATAPAGPPRAPATRRSSPRPRISELALAALIVALLLPGLAFAEDVAALTAEAYAAWKAEDATAARDLARRAIETDGGEASLTARKLLILALEKLGEVGAALAALDDYRSFPLVEKDRRWAEETAARLEPLLPEPAAPAPAGDPPADAPPDEPTPAPEPAPAASTPPLVLGVGGGWRNLAGTHYGAAALDLGGDLVGGVLRLVGGAELAVSEPAGCGSEAPAGDADCRSLLPGLSLGVGVRADMPTDAAPTPFVDVRFLAAPHGNPDYLPVQAGLTVGGGIELAPASAPVAPRLRAAVDLLSPLADGAGPTLGGRVILDAAFRLGGRR